jgi:hypothetical protein
MLRQCAWCLRLIDHVGERLSTQPLPKLYEASHGMCGVCGALWMEQVLTQAPPLYSDQGTESEPQYAIDFAIQYRDRNTMPAVCESSSEYSSHVRYSFSDGPESLAVDDTSDQDLNKINRQRRP